MNSAIKLASLLITAILFLFGLCMIALGSYLISAPWSELDPEYYGTWCAYVISFGVVLVFFSVVGCCGSLNQMKREGNFTGRRIMAIYQLCCSAIVIGLLVLATDISETVESLDVARDSLSTSQVLPFDKFEDEVSRNFNSFYYSASTDCGSQVSWFWDWVDENCKSANMQESVCEDCGASSSSYCPSPGTCPCKSNCDADEMAGECPYVMCRRETLDYVIETMSPIGTFTLFLACFIIMLVTFNCLLICYNPKDDFKGMLLKTGAYDAALLSKVISGRKLK